MTPRARAGLVGGGMVALAVIALGVFVLPFAFPTPPPIVTRFGSTLLFSPNGDGRRDTARVSVRMHDPGRATLEVVGGDGTVVRTLLDDEPLPRGFTRPRWDGTDTDGRVVLDGTYVLRLRASSGRKKFNISRRIVVDTVAPTPDAMTVASAGLAGAGEGECRASVTPAEDAVVTLEAAATPDGPAAASIGPRPVQGDRSLTWNWDGREGGATVAPGLYLVRATLEDATGNRTVRLRTCWVGHVVGRAVPAGAGPGDRVGVRLTTTAGRPLPASTPVQISLYRRRSTPGGGSGEPLGRRIGGTARGPQARATVRLPERLRPDALWMVAETRTGRALVPLGTR